MGSYDATFDATNIEPQQSGGRHQVGNKFPATITNTDVKDTKDNSGKYFEVEFSSPGGTIRNNYNLWNSNAQAVKIAAGQLSALCHATGIFQINMRDGGKNLRGAKCLIDVNFQNGQEPTADKPEGGYVEIKKIYDVNGNEPSRGAQPQSQQQSNGFGQQGAATSHQNQQQPQGQQQPQPQTQQGWGSGNTPNAAPQVQNGGNWGGNQQSTSNAAVTGGWQQGAAQQSPPWSNK